jgi:hypothetical protein
VKTYSGFKRFTRRLIWGSLILGISLSGIFITTDLTSHPWWENKSYIPNVLAAITGFLIGAPLALVILATFTNEREEKAVLDRVNGLSLTAWNAFRDLIDDFCSNERYEVISEHARDVHKYFDQAINAMDQYIELANQVLGTTSENDLSQSLESLREIEQKFRASINVVTRTFNFQTNDEWAQIIGSWRVLDQYVRLQRLEQGLEWFDKVPDSGFRRWMSRESNPLQEFLDSIEVRRYIADSSMGEATMRQAVGTLGAYVRMDALELGEYLLYYGNPFSKERSREYFILVEDARIFVLELKRLIGLVEIQNWPRGQTVAARDGDDRELTMHEWIGSLQTPEGEEEFKKLWKTVQAAKYQESLRRLPPGYTSGSYIPPGR